MTYLLAYLLTSLCAGLLWFCLARFTDEEQEMMTVTFLRRPIRMRLRWWLEAQYLRMLIRHAERDQRGHMADLTKLRDDAERMSIQIDWDEKYILSLAQRLGKVLAK